MRRAAPSTPSGATTSRRAPARHFRTVISFSVVGFYIAHALVLASAQ
jgi:hypothetical protein